MTDPTGSKLTGLKNRLLQLLPGQKKTTKVQTDQDVTPLFRPVVAQPKFDTDTHTLTIFMTKGNSSAYINSQAGDQVKTSANLYDFAYGTVTGHMHRDSEVYGALQKMYEEKLISQFDITLTRNGNEHILKVLGIKIKDNEKGYVSVYVVPESSGGATLGLKPTQERAKIGKLTRVVYTNKRGTKYVKVNKRFPRRRQERSGQAEESREKVDI